MTHLVTLLRAAALGVGERYEVLLSTGAVVAFVALAWLLAVRRLRRALIAQTEVAVRPTVSLPACR